MELDAIAGIVIGRLAGYEAGCHGAAMLGTTPTRIVLVQIVGQGVPTAANPHHNMGAQDLIKKIPG